MVKYTHLIERCSGFLRIGIAWRLKPHGYTFTGAYWRLREGKGLISAYDQESLKMWGNLVTAVRRRTAPAGKLKPEDQTALKEKKENLLQRMEAYRDWLEQGARPQYLHDGTSPSVIEHLLATRVGDPRWYTSEQQLDIWQQLDLDDIILEAEQCMKEVQTYTDKYHNGQGVPDTDPQQWMEYNFSRRFVKDKVWQIRTGHDDRSSVGAGINDRLNFIWDIPSQTDVEHRDIYEANHKVLDTYRQWKEGEGPMVTYDTLLTRAHEVLDSIRIPCIK